MTRATESIAGFRHVSVHVADTAMGRSDIKIFASLGGDGPPLLLLHGHPQTHRVWHRVAPQLAKRFTVIAADLRGYGASSKPAADDPQLLDIAPTLAMYEQTNRQFATQYFHWFFLIQPEPLPETLIGAAPHVYIERVIGSRHAGLEAFAPHALHAYRQALAQPGAVHAMCEDYRASAGIDLLHERVDLEQGNKLACPLRVLWGEHGVLAQCFDPLVEWRRVARDVSGRALPCGHYIPEEAPQALLEEIDAFFDYRQPA